MSHVTSYRSGDDLLDEMAGRIGTENCSVRFDVSRFKRQLYDLLKTLIENIVRN
jgi:hypothetical protein